CNRIGFYRATDLLFKSVELASHNPASLGYVAFQRTFAFVACLQFSLVGRYQLYVELYFGERRIQIKRRGLGRIVYAVGFYYQLIAGGKGEVVVGVLITRQVDLGSQVLVTRFGHEVVNVRRTAAVTA